MIDERASQVCPRCGHSFTIHSRPIIDEGCAPEMFRKFMDDGLNPRACADCDLPFNFDTPCIVLCKHWIGVVLANPQPITIQLACDVVLTFLTETPGLTFPPERPVLVTGNADQLRRLIRSGTADRFCLIRFDDLTRRNWSLEIVGLNVIADAYLEHDMPEEAYWVFESALSTFPDLYFDRRFFDMLELTAMAAGDRMAQSLKEPRTAPADLELKRQLLEPQRPDNPAFLSNTYLLFYEDDRPFKDGPRFLWNVRVELMLLDEQGNLPFEQAELHLTGVPMQAVQPIEPSRLDRGVLRILIVLLVTAARQRLPEEPKDFSWAHNLSAAFLQTDWEVMTAPDRGQLCEIYAQLTDGRDLVREFRLDEAD